jgi:hypothetical protein
MSRNKSYDQQKRSRNEKGYIGRVFEMLQTGELPMQPGTVTMLNVQHDVWCDKLKDGECNCSPDFVLEGVE